MSAAPAMNSALQVTIEIVRGPNQGFKQTFHQNKWTVGRGPENDLVLAQDLKISRNHIEVQCTGAQVFVRNKSQKNIMMVDGLLAIEAILKPESVVQIGETYIRLKFDRPPEKPSLKAVPQSQTPAVKASTSAATGAAAGARMPANHRPGAGPVGFVSAAGGLGPRRQPPPQVELPLVSNPRFRFYSMVLAIGLVAAWYFSQTQIGKAPERLRDSIVVTEELAKSEEELKAIREDMEKRGVDTPQFRLADAQFIRGFRDYQNGQYARAMEAFQSARSFYPGHELATRYWTLSKRKLDERVQAYMIQGRRYLGTQNYRLCKSSFAAVLKQVKDDRNPIYQEALKFHEECRLKGDQR